MNIHFTKDLLMVITTWNDTNIKVTGEMRIKTTTRYHSIPLRMAKIISVQHGKCWWKCEATGTLRQCCWERKVVQPLWKKGRQVNTPTVGTRLSMILGVHPREMRALSHRHTHMWIFMEASFVIATNWKQPKRPSRGKRVDKSWHIHNPHNGRLWLSNKKQWSIDLSNNMGDSQNNYAEWKTNQGTYGMIPPK